MATNKLTALAVTNLVKGGLKARTGDGGGLYLDVRAKGRATWVFRYMMDGKAREAGLGRAEDVTLAEARDAASDLRKLSARKIDPLEQKAQLRADALAARAAARRSAALEHWTFKRVADARMTAKEAEYRNEKHRQQWRNTLKTYAYPLLGDLPVADITREVVLAVLTPIWTLKPETASRLRQRIEVVLDYAEVMGWRTGSNPAAWKGRLDQVLPSHRKTRVVRHHPALPWVRVPELMEQLKGAEGLGALALRFAILTAARSGEVRGATWAELDLEHATWNVPADRMKGKKTHRVPLSAEALDVLSAVRPFRGNDGPDGLIFPSIQTRRMLSDMSLAAVIKRLNDGDRPTWVDGDGHAVVPHGFRSSFRDWCADTQPEPSEVVEAALAHAIRNATEAAYRRGDLFERRKVLMSAWGAFCQGEPAANVTSLNEARAR